MGSIRRAPTFSILLFVLAVALAAAPAPAQRMTGSAGVGVQVTDRDGQPIEGAEVELAPAEGDAEAGPPVVVTDARGRAAIRGLAPGEWVLTIRHPDTMAYVARLNVREGKKPKELSASQVKVGESLRSLRLSYFEESGPGAPFQPREVRPAPRPAPESRPAPAPAPVSEPAPPPQAPRPERPTEQEAPASVAPPSVQEQAPQPAPTTPPEAPPEVEPPAPRPVPEPAPQPAPVPVPQPERQPEEGAVPAPAPQEPPQTPPPRPVPPRPEPTPVPTPTPAPAPAPGPGPEPPRGLTLRSSQDGTCAECQSGEWAVAASGSAAPGDGVCPPDLEQRIDRAAGLLGSSRALGPWTGQVDAGEGGASSVLGDAAYREYRTVLEPLMGAGSSCQAVAVLLPAGARFAGFQYEVGERGQWVQCLPGGECPAGGGRWPANPILARTPAGTVVAGVYQNRSGGARRIRLTVYFAPPEGWSPR